MTDAQRARAVAPLETAGVSALRQDETLSAYGRRIARPRRWTLRAFARALRRSLRPQTPNRKEGPMTPTEWDAYIADAANGADTTERTEEAVRAGVDFAALLAVQADRIGAER